VSTQPWTFEQAGDNCRAAARAQESAEQTYLQAARTFAQAEEKYRKALAVEIVRQHDEESVAWSVAPDLARGDEQVARLRRERDIAEGVREAMQQALWRAISNRKDAQRFTDWSMRRELAEAAGTTPEPTYEAPIGAVAA
jgi:hypothetical protein